MIFAGVVAGLIGLLGPWVIARVPEPPDPDEGKPTYPHIAQPRWLAPLLGLVSALCAVAVAWAIGSTWMLGSWIAICGVGSWLAYIDLRTRLLPYVIVAPLYAVVWALVGVAAWAESEPRVALRALIANVVVYVIFRGLHLLGRLFGGSFGYGDVRLAAVLSVALGPLGPQATLTGLYAGFLIGAVFGIGLSIARRATRGSFAFGPYLLLGAVVGVVWTSVVFGT